ncbi:unnamed protein product, partial [marine sediment metagenome]
DIDGTNLNREWDSTVSTEVNVVRDKLDEIDDNFGVDIFLDWHSQMDGLSDSFIYSYTSQDAYNFFDNLSKWTDFDDNSPGGIGDLGVAKNYGLNRGILSFTVEPSPHYASWTIESLELEGKNTAFAIDEYFTPTFMNSEFDNNMKNADLMTDATSLDQRKQDESALLTSDISIIAIDSGKKHPPENYDIDSNVDLTEKINSAQSGTIIKSHDI